MILRVYIAIWILGWVACLIAFMSVFFSSRKTVFKNLLDSSLTPGYLSSFQAFSYHNLDTSSTPGGSIEKVLVPSVASWHLMDRSSLISCVWCFCTSTLARHLYLLMAISSVPGSTPCSTPLDTFIFWALLRFYLYFLERSEPHFSRSLSRYLYLFTSQTSLTHS